MTKNPKWYDAASDGRKRFETHLELFSGEERDKEAASIIDQIKKSVVGESGELNEFLHRHPTFQRYLRHISSGPIESARNTKPWHAVGERLFWRYMASLGDEVGWIPPDLKWKERSLTYEMAAKASQLYLWSNECRTKAAQMPDLPRHVVSPTVMPYPFMFFSFETCDIVRPSEEDAPRFGLEPGKYETNHILLIGMPDGLLCFSDLSRDGRSAFIGTPIHFGAIYPDDLPSEDARMTVGVILKMLAFLNLKLVDSKKEKMERAERRRIARAGFDETESEQEIAVVTLRALERKAHASKENEEVDWKHHWWVRGHWRAQWHPSEKAHHIMWIDPHMKGDLGKPLLEKMYHVKR